MTDVRFAVIGRGRAGGSFQAALVHRGADCVAMLGRGDDPATLDTTLDLVIVAVPDRAIADVAEHVPTGPLVVHLSGATDLRSLRAHHERCGSLHPLVSLTDSERGAAALLAGPHMAVAAPTPELVAEVRSIAELLGAQTFIVDDNRRASYHAAASVAANHLVGLVAQVERIADADGLPLAPFTTMMRAVIDNIDHVGVAASLTGPVARGDWDTVRAHLAATDPADHGLYIALAQACATLAGHALPADLFPTESPR